MKKMKARMILVGVAFIAVLAAGSGLAAQTDDRSCCGKGGNPVCAAMEQSSTDNARQKAVEANFEMNKTYGQWRR